MDKDELNERISQAIGCGVIKDARPLMPKGPGAWKKRSLDRIVGVCLHQNGSNNFDRPLGTARYHTGPNHIDSKGLPSTVYNFMVPDLAEPAWLTNEIDDVTWAQGDEHTPGSENEFLLSVLVMGNYDGPGHRGSRPAPSKGQMKALETLLAWLQHTFGFGDEGIFGHLHFRKPACPGFALMGYIEARREGCDDLQSDMDWQLALLARDPLCLPRWGADGDWGTESQRALISFQRDVRFSPKGFKDPFTELLLLRQLCNAKVDLAFLRKDDEVVGRS